MSHASSEQPALNHNASPLKPGGSIAITTWTPVDQSPATQTKFGALRAIKPDLPKPQRGVTKAFPVGSTGDFWDNMVRGSAPIQMMKKSIMSVRGEPVEPHSENMSEALWREKEKLALAWLEETLPTLKRPLTSDAWLGMGVK
ncbi:hypothetical protein [Sideroxydans sp. CL21]|uniref:hypothetical protein n=1 Tax=Sideroxydans sp. CL21 TaxID=2600596 RepID=UPI0024BD2D2C|nr:hypothetical protein [Sideroxydans sp. CL21]